MTTSLVIDLAKARKRLRGDRSPPKRPPKILETLDLAEQWRRRLEAGGVNQADLARERGVSHARVTQILKLLRLEPSLLAWVRANPLGLSERKLRPLLELPPSHQVVVAAHALGMSGRESG